MSTENNFEPVSASYDPDYDNKYRRHYIIVALLSSPSGSWKTIKDIIVAAAELESYITNGVQS